MSQSHIPELMTARAHVERIGRILRNYGRRALVYF